jgi:hypothetical protein
MLASNPVVEVRSLRIGGWRGSCYPWVSEAQAAELTMPNPRFLSLLRCLRLVVTIAVMLMLTGRVPVPASGQDGVPDLRGPLRLTAEARDGHIRTCRAIGLRLATNRQVPRPTSAEVNVMQEKYCDCVVNQFEDRSSKLQFLMIMEQAMQVRAMLPFEHNLRELPKVRAAAVANGFSRADYDSAQAELPAIALAAVNTCNMTD